MRGIVNFARAGAWPNTWYPNGQRRLKQSLWDIGWPGGILCFSDESEVNCPSHQMVPYAFKTGALNEAVRRGYTTLLWADASVFAVKPLNPVFEHIEKYGHLFFQAGFNCAQWTNDRALSIMGVSRDEAEKMPMLMALCMGLDVRHERSRLFLERFTEAVKTDAFRGEWTNDLRTESLDVRCQGHRHDQSVASILAAQLGMDLTPGVFLAYFTRHLYDYGSRNDMTGIPETVALLAQGMNS